MSEPRLLDSEEIVRQLADLPGVHPGPSRSLVLGLKAPTFPAAVELIGLVAEDAEQLDHHPDIDLRWRTVTFTLSTHSAGGVTQLDVELAHRILEAGRTVGATATAAPGRLEIALDCQDPAAIMPFWEAGLGYRRVETDKGSGFDTELYDPSGHGPVLWFQPMDPARSERSRFHLDVYVPDDAAPQRIAECIGAGGRVLSDAFAPSWWVLADVEGNELCICTRLPHRDDR
jgi:4a-hydroxytetrahydrobiopterin dehydratase